MGTLPSAASLKALTGRLSPFWALTARMTVRTYQGEVVSFSSGSSMRSAQAAGTGISWRPVSPASTAAQFILTTFSPFRP